MLSRNRLSQIFAAVLATVALSTAVVQPVKAQALSDFAENKIIDALMRAQTIGTPVTWYVALYTTACSDTGGGTEVPNSNNYSRASLGASLANWAGTQSAGSTVASSGTGGVTSNNTVITFATPSGTWGTVTHAGLVDSGTWGGGNLWVCIDINPDKTINSGDTVSFAAGALTVTMQ